MEVAPAKILIVDDAPEFCETLAWLLTDEGYACRVAGDRRQAIDMLGQEKANLILLDWEMPVMNGAAFLKRRSLRVDLRRIPVLVLSAAFDIEDDAVQMKASFLQKPIDFARLLTCVKRLLARSLE
jgi:DNA-binding response OmpR family regulator